MLGNDMCHVVCPPETNPPPKPSAPKAVGHLMEPTRGASLPITLFTRGTHELKFTAEAIPPQGRC